MLQAGWKHYFVLKNQCNQSDTYGREVKQMLFNPMESDTSSITLQSNFAFCFIFN